MNNTDKENECIDSHLNMCSFDIINETSEEVKYAQNKSKIVKLHQNHGICTFARGVFYLGYDSRNEEITSLKAELEQLKHEYREKLGYLSSNKTVVQTPVSIELVRLEMQQLIDAKENENKYLKAELEKARELLRGRTRYSLQNEIENFLNQGKE